MSVFYPLSADLNMDTMLCEVSYPCNIFVFLADLAKLTSLLT